jgi:hypothetical protein
MHKKWATAPGVATVYNFDISRACQHNGFYILSSGMVHAGNGVSGETAVQRCEGTRKIAREYMWSLWITYLWASNWYLITAILFQEGQG